VIDGGTTSSLGVGAPGEDANSLGAKLLFYPYFFKIYVMFHLAIVGTYLKHLAPRILFECNLSRLVDMWTRIIFTCKEYKQGLKAKEILYSLLFLTSFTMARHSFLFLRSEVKATFTLLEFDF